MDLKRTYLLLCGLGLVLPYARFMAFLQTHGFDIALLLRQVFEPRQCLFCLGCGGFCLGSCRLYYIRVQTSCFQNSLASYPCDVYCGRIAWITTFSLPKTEKA
jgi:hypothetical protein